MKKELKIIKKTRKQHLCFGCFKIVASGSTSWCLKTIDNGEDFRWFHGKMCYDKFEARTISKDKEVKDG